MAAFTPGNIVVYRVGTGAAALSGAATAVFLDEYTPAGALVQSIALPTADVGANQTLTAAGTATSEGFLTRSADGQYLVLGGYDATPGTATPNTTSSATVTRVLGRVAIDGTVDTTTTTTAFSGGNIRGVASIDGSGFWATGNNTGLVYQPFGGSGASTIVSSTVTNLRAVEIYGGQLYASSASGANFGVLQVGVGAPTTTGQAATLLPGLPTASGPSPYSFVLLDLSPTVAGVDTLYVADDRSLATGGGLQKWTYNGTSWALTNTDSTGLTAGLRGLTASVSGAVVTLYGTSADTLSKIVGLTDASGYGAALTASFTTIATAATNTAFRDIAFVPQAAVTTTETISVTTAPLTQNEGDTGASSYSYVLTRTGSTAAAATVSYAVIAATAGLDGADFLGGALPAGTATFAAGSATATIVVNVAGDRTIEATEGFTLTLANPSSGYVVSAAAGTGAGTIANDDVAGTVSVADVSVIEGTNQAVVTLTRAGGAGDITVNYTTADGGAVAGSDYTAAAGTESFTGGATSVQVPITLIDDTAAEGDEAFTVTLTAGTGAPTIGGTGVATVTILDNDFAVGVADVTVSENAGTATITLTRNSGSGDVAIGYATANGGATAPGDYTATTGTATFTGTATTTSFTIPIADDMVAEGPESFAVNLSVASGNATLIRPAATVSITDNDGVVIPAGSFTAPFAATAATSYTLLANTTRTQTAGGGVSVTSTAGPVNVDIEGTLSDTASGQRAINFGNQAIQSSLVVGVGGVVQSLNGDTVRFQSVNGTANLTNLGQILMTATPFTPNASGATAGTNNPGAAFAVTYNAALGAAGAPATDYSSGGTITNGSTTNSIALIRSDNGDAVRLGSHETLTNYGAISGAGPINDSPDNNAFASNGQTSIATPYDISRGVRINQAGATAVKVDNFGTIAGAQHGLDVGVVDATNLVFINEVGGTILGRNGSGIGADTTGAAATTVTVNNFGTITGAYAPAYDRAGYATIDGDGDGIDVDGAATINNFAGGVIRSTGAGGFDKNGRANNSEGLTLGGGVVTNAGAITGAKYGVVVNNDSNANGSRTGYAATTIVNQAGGAITGGDGFAIRLENKAGTAIDNDAITNYGTITGNGAIPTATVNLQSGSADTFTVGTLDDQTYTAANAGSARFISGDGAAIQTGEGADTLVNYGAIVGNTGRAINLEGGADALTLYTGSSVTGRIDGGAGVDTLTLAIDNRVNGNAATGANSGANAGTLANVVNFEALSVAGGSWTIADAQTYSAGTTIASGATLVLTTGAALGGAVADNGGLVANGTGVATLAGSISGTGRVQQAGTGTLVLTNAANSYSGGTTLASTGTLDVAAQGAAGSGAITFFGGAQTLRIEAAALNAGVFANMIAGFATDGDIIDVRGVGLAAASYNGVTGVLTLSGTSSASLTLGTGYAGLVFATASDGAGGTNVTVAPPPPTLSIGAASVIEGNGGVANLVFTVTASAAAGAGGIGFTATSADGSATVADGDYTAIAGSYSIAAGQTSTTVTVAVTGDTRIEASETLSVTLSNPTNATLGAATATGTIVNDDLPALSISDPSVVEGNAGATVLRYTVTASAPAPVGGIGFTIATADGTATAGGDYVARTVTGATIAAGQTSYTFDVTVNGDTTPERAETVLVNLSNPTGATIADPQGVGIIDNDDGAPAGLQDYFASSFNGFTAAGFAPAPAAGQLDSTIWRVAGLSDNPNPVFGGAYTTASTDFTRGVINGAADPTSGGVYSPSANPALVVQPTGTDFENGGFIEAQLVNTTGFTATSFSVAFDWAYRNSGDRADALTFSYSTDGSTYVTVPAAAFTTPGAKDAATAATFSLQNETLTIDNVLVGDGNAVFLRWTHTGSTGGGNRDEVGIDNVVVRAAVSDIQTASAPDVTVIEGTGGQSFATFTITRSSGTGAASIAYTTADGTALAGRDYTAQSGTISFAEGERSKTIAVAITPDAQNEAAETFFLNLSNARGATVTDAQARATILNDDMGPVGIYDIQGAGHVSPFNGQAITTGGIVTQINGTGFWIQDTAGDGLFATSDAIQVFIGAAPTGVAPGDLVTVAATVSEFTPTTGALSVTELTAPTITVTGHGALPAAVLIGIDGILPPTNIIDDDRLQTFDPQNDAIDFYEALEGMLVTVEAPQVTAPSLTNSAGQHSTYVIASGGAGATNVDARGGIVLTGDDGASERIQIFGDASIVPTSTLGDRLANVTGILTYYNFPELLPNAPVVTTSHTATTQEQTLLRPDADHLQIASFNIENADPTDPQAKFDAIGVEVTNALGRPDIIGLQEVQDADGAGAGTNYSGMATAQKVIDAIIAAGGPTYTYIEIAPTANNTTGGEPNGNIRNGYLYNAARVSYVDGSVQLIDDPAYTNTRRPLVASFVFNGTTLTVIDQHSTSRGGSDLSFGANQPPAQAGDAARTAQAVAIKAYIDNLQAADPNAHVVTVGDFNGYYYEPALSALTADGKLTNLYTLLPVAERYSYVFEGASQAFDNIIVSNNLLPQAQFDVVHYNAEQAVQPITDHDQAVASFYIPRANTAPTDLAIDKATVAENAPAGTLVGTLATTDAQGGVFTYALTDSANGRFAIDAATGRLTTTQPLDYETTPGATVTVKVTDSGGLSYAESFAIAVTDVNEAPARVTISNANVTENAAGGTVIGTLSGNDPDAGDSIAFALATPDARFRISGNQLLVAPGADIDYETQASIALAVTATDRAGLSTTTTLTLAVQDVAETFAGTAGADTITGDAGANTINGGAGDDVIFGRGGADTIDGGDGNDTINGGAGADRITLGAGSDTVRALLSELLGDTIVDLTSADRIVVQNSDIHRPDFAVAGSGASTALQFAGGAIALPGGHADGDFMVAHAGIDSTITFQGYLATLSEGKAVAADAINGIVNQPYLTGDTSTAFTVQVEALSGAQYANTLGVYEIDTATGAISDVRIVAANVKSAGAISVTGVDVGHQLGFFIVQNGANRLSSAVLNSTTLSFVSQGGALVLADNGAVVAGATTFFSHAASANVDGATHVLSGVAADGSGDLRLGFEDLLRSGHSDNDFQDVVLTVHAVAQTHATSDVPIFATSAVDAAPHAAFVESALTPLQAADVAVLHP